MSSPIPVQIARALFVGVLMLFAVGVCRGAEPWTVEMNRLALTLLEMPTVTAPGTPVPVRVRIQNSGDAVLGG